MSVQIPAGVDNGDRIRLSGQGEAGPAGAPAGDLYVEVHVREHAIFQRDGNDLHCELPIRFSQAALGAELPVPTLEGEVPITIPPETQTGQLVPLARPRREVGAQQSHRRPDLPRGGGDAGASDQGSSANCSNQLEATFAGGDADQHTPRAKTLGRRRQAVLVASHFVSACAFPERGRRPIRHCRCTPFLAAISIAASVFAAAPGRSPRMSRPVRLAINGASGRMGRPCSA